MSKYENPWSLNTYLKVYQRDNFTCQDCGKVWRDGDTFNIHHVVPRSKGGGNELDNLILLCKPCHMKRHTKPSNILSYEDMLLNLENNPLKVRLNHFTVDPLGISVKQMASLLKIPESKAYELSHIKGFPSANLGGRTIIYYQGLWEWLTQKVRTKV